MYWELLLCVLLLGNFKKFDAHNWTQTLSLKAKMFTGAHMQCVSTCQNFRAAFWILHWDQTNRVEGILLKLTEVVIGGNQHSQSKTSLWKTTCGIQMFGKLNRHGQFSMHQHQTQCAVKHFVKFLHQLGIGHNVPFTKSHQKASIKNSKSCPEQFKCRALLCESASMHWNNHLWQFTANKMSLVLCLLNGFTRADLDWWCNLRGICNIWIFDVQFWHDTTTDVLHHIMSSHGDVFSSHCQSVHCCCHWNIALCRWHR